LLKTVSRCSGFAYAESAGFNKMRKAASSQKHRFDASQFWSTPDIRHANPGRMKVAQLQTPAHFVRLSRLNAGPFTPD